METEQWLVGWRAIGKYLGRSGKTAQRYAREGMPFFRDPGGRPIAKPSMLDEYIVDLNKGAYNHGKTPWYDDGIANAVSYVEEKEKVRQDFEKELIEAQKKTRSHF